MVQFPAVAVVLPAKTCYRAQQIDTSVYGCSEAEQQTSSRTEANSTDFTTKAKYNRKQETCRG